MESVNAIYGTFACHASNIAGTGEKCSISIDGPPSALVADTDTTYLIFGGASVILLLLIIVGSIIVCRRHSGNIGCRVFERGGIKRERFLPKNQHI